MEELDYGYNIKVVDAGELPQGVDASKFEGEIWLVTLQSKPQAYCSSENFAKLIVTYNLARPTINLGDTVWFDHFDGPVFRATCVGMTIRLLQDFITSGRSR